jgi:hypothetical protein
MPMFRALFLERFACECAGDAGWFGAQGKKGAFPCKGTPFRRHGAVRREFPAPPRGAQCGEPHKVSWEFKRHAACQRTATRQCAAKRPAARVHSYANRSNAGMSLGTSLNEGALPDRGIPGIPGLDQFL